MEQSITDPAMVKGECLSDKRKREREGESVSIEVEEKQQKRKGWVQGQRREERRLAY